MCVREAPILNLVWNARFLGGCKANKIYVAACVPIVLGPGKGWMGFFILCKIFFCEVLTLF